MPVGEGFIDSKYKNPDNDPRGPWQSISASVQAGHAVASQFYSITSPTGKEFNPPKGRCWSYNQERMLREIADGNIWFGLDGNNTPRIKKFLKDAKIGLTPETLWSGDNYGTTDSAKKHLLSLFPDVDQVFDTPKPEELIKQILEIGSNEGDLILDCYLGSGTTIATAHKLNRRYIGIEIGEQMTNLVVRRLNDVIAGEQGGISQVVNWQGGGEFAYYDFDNKIREKQPSSLTRSVKNVKPVSVKQLNLYELFDRYKDNPIVENSMVHEDLSMNVYGSCGNSSILPSKNCLIGLVKKDNLEQYVERSAKIYYTGKKFPSTVALNKLFYFMPYLKNKGVRDLYLIKVARIGTRKEGQCGEAKNDLRLVFDIEFVKQFFDDYMPVELKIWRTFTDTTVEKIMLAKDEQKKYSKTN